MRKLIVKLNYALWALKRINKPHIGDIVTYNGEECSLIQGVAAPYWDLLPLSKENLDKPKRNIYKRIHTLEFQLDRSLKRKIWSFKTSYKFKMGNWFLIDTYKKSIFSSISNIG